MGRLARIVRLVVAAALVGSVVSAPALPGAAIGTEPPPITSFAVGTEVEEPTGITTGADGRLWFVGAGNDTIGRFAPEGAIEVDPTTGVERPWAIASGPDGNLWITGRGNDTIGRIDPADASVDAFALTGVDDPVALTAGPDGNVWVVGRANDTVARVTPAGVGTVFPLPPGTGPAAVVVGGDGDLWVAGEANGTLVEMEPTDGTVLATHPAGLPTPVALATLDDGDLWLLGGAGGEMGRVEVATGTVTTSPVARPYELVTPGPGGDVWVAERSGLARVDPDDGTVTVLRDGSSSETFRGLRFGPDGNLWLTSDLNASPSVPAYSPTGRLVERYTFAGEGACWARDLAAAPDGNLWVVGGRVVSELAPDGRVLTVRHLPHRAAQLGFVAAVAPGGDVWAYGRSGSLADDDRLYRFPTGAGVEETAVDLFDGREMVFDGGGTLWAVDRARVTRVDTDGTVTYSTTSAEYDAPWDVAVGPDGGIWWAGNATDTIGRLDPATGLSVRYPAGVDGPIDLAFGPDGNVWVVGILDDRVAVLDPATGQVLDVHAAGLHSPAEIVSGPDGNLWFTGLTGGLARMTPTGAVTTYPLGGSPGADVWELIVGPDDNLWVPGPHCTVRRISLASPAVSLTKSAVDPDIVAGEAAEWEITVTNTGDVGLRDVEVADPSAAGCAGPLADLGVGESVTVACSTPTDDDDVGTLVNEATVTADPELGLGVSAAGSATVTVGPTTTTSTTTSTTIGPTTTTGPAAPPVTEPPRAGPDDLARTGADVARLVGVGLALVGLGVGARGVARRRTGRAAR